MGNVKREKLEAQGWKVGTVAEFLELTPEEEILLEIKLALSRSLRERRRERMTPRCNLRRGCNRVNRALPKRKAAMPRFQLNC